MNETPWKVIGYEKFTSEAGDACTRLYVVRPLVLSREENIQTGTCITSFRGELLVTDHFPGGFIHNATDSF